MKLERFGALGKGSLYHLEEMSALENRRHQRSQQQTPGVWDDFIKTTNTILIADRQDSGLQKQQRGMVFTI